MPFFFLIAIVVWSLLHYYVGRRVIPKRWPKGSGKRKGAWSLLMFFGIAAPIAMLGGRFLPAIDIVHTLRTVGYGMMGLSVLLVAFVFGRDLIWWATRGADSMLRKRNGGTRGVLPADPGRREFLFGASSATVAAATVACTGAGVVAAFHRPDIRPTDVPIEGLHPALDGLRIAQLSDVHVGPTIAGRDLADMVARVNALEPDLVVITGDLVDGYVSDIGDQITPLADLKARHGAFFCTGNHEYFWDGPAWSAHVARQGVTVLDNAHSVVEHDGARLLVGGVTDYRAERYVPHLASDARAALAGAPEVDFKLLLAHQPQSRDAAASAGFDMQISGHTHGGQFFPFNIVLYMALPVLAGVHKHRDMTLFVSTGAGYWGPPNRLGVPSEIPLLTLRRA